MREPTKTRTRISFACTGPLTGFVLLAVAERTGWNTFAGHDGVRDFFESRGYEVLDRFQLARFMEASNEESGRSVVVFAMDDLEP